MRFKLLNSKKRMDVRGKENRKNIADKVYHTMNFMFDSGKCTQPKMIQHDLIGELQKICKFPDFNKSGRSYSSRLYLNYKDEDHDDENSTKRKISRSKPKKRKAAANKKKAKNTKTQCNGPRLIWLQMVPGMVRLQQWIHQFNLAPRQDLVAADLLTRKNKKRKRRKTLRNDKAQPPCKIQLPKAKPRSAGKRKRNRKRAPKKQYEDGETIHQAKLKNFIVVPQHDYHLKHFAIDSKSLFDVIKNLTAFRSNGKGLYTQNEFIDLVADPENVNSKTVNPF